MPATADTQLLAEYQARVVNRFKELFDKSHFDTQEHFFIEFSRSMTWPGITKSSYYSFVLHLNPVRRSTGERLLRALGFEPREIDEMIEAVSDRGSERDTSTAPNYKPISDAALTTSVSSSRPQLPIILTNLIGREHEIAAITRLLERARLVTLVGEGGVGKTRLSMAVAERVRPLFHDGVRYVELANLMDPNLIEIAVAQILGVKEQQGQPLTETMVRWLSGRSLLLILDNCEHIRLACAQLTENLLSQCANLHILATSRISLGLTGETVFRVSHLQVPSRSLEHSDLEVDKNAPSHLMQYSAMRLFVDRAIAQGVVRSFTASDLQAIAEICRQLDGNPLAIEMAAARTRMMRVEDICSRLMDRFSLLRRDEKSRPRHQTLGALIDWSYELLSEAEKKLLQWLSVFATGFTIEAAEHIASSGGRAFVFDDLTSLVDISLVMYEEREGRARYYLPETVRMYAATALAKSGEREASRNQHLAYFLALAEEAEPKLVGADQGQWLDILELENDNFRTALNWCLQDANDPISALRLAGSLNRFWYTRGYHTEGRDWLERILKISSDAPVSLRVKGLKAAGNLAYVECDNGQARVYFEECLRLSSEVNDARVQAMALASLANVEAAERNHSLARAYSIESLKLFEEQEDVRGIALTLGNLAIVASAQGDYRSALDYHMRALANLRQLADFVSIGIELNNLIHTLLKQGKLDAVHPYLKESLVLSQELQSPRILAHCLTNSGTLAVKLDHWEHAAVIIGAETALLERIDFPLPSTVQNDYEQGIVEVCRHLDHKTYEETTNRGRNMKPDELQGFLLDWLDEF